MAVVCHSSCSNERDLMLDCDSRNKRIKTFLEFRWDQIPSVFGTVDGVDTVVGIGMAHARIQVSRRITGRVPRLRRSESRPLMTQPFRAGLTFGGRPSGP